MTSRRVLVPALLAALLAACGGPSSVRSAPPPTSAPRGAASASATSPSPSGPAPSVAADRVRKLLVVVEENHAAGEALAAMPFLAAQARRFAVATSYRAVTHPSLPNYLALAGGSSFGVHDDGGPSAHPLRGPSVFGQALAGGGSARTYAEGMPAPCTPYSAGRYAVKHNPWAYFLDERPACGRDDVPLGTTAAGALHDDVAAGRLPTFALVVPDTCHDAHDGPLATADGWLEGWLRQVEAGPDFRSGALAVVVTFDEDDRSAGNRVLAVVAQRSLHAMTVDVALGHLAVSAAASRLVGATPLRAAASAPDLLAAFGLR